ncbi:DUF3597 domain-containing protein [Aureimonas sp. SK2]|uniref:DUF3597 domain-containing protein n=1 Tax=Aureimonas sp. SK2 TaxID=3015992 RepID=UPI002444A534|nr:DUF3597 domain-containing protein [Aureimonas sp. SK2]
MSFFERIKSKIFGSAHADTPATEAAPQAATGPASTPASTNIGGTAAPAGVSPAPSPQILAPSAGAPGTSDAVSPATAGTSSPVASTPGASPIPASAPAGPVDVAAVLDGKAKGAGQTLNWRHSIVDLLKLLDLDSSLSARRELAQELGYTGDHDDSAAMNTWLHRQVMTKLAANGGTVPAELRD